MTIERKITDSNGQLNLDPSHIYSNDTVQNGLATRHLDETYPNLFLPDAFNKSGEIKKNNSTEIKEASNLPFTKASPTQVKPDYSMLFKTQDTSEELISGGSKIANSQVNYFSPAYVIPLGVLAVVLGVLISNYIFKRGRRQNA
ncbi:MAG: hypothetical protein LBM27_04530 [Lactobacillaceae bacterium]|jgi:hypothetical protein|nr:hypothetical protein [Lactobacillaceae bacterium]